MKKYLFLSLICSYSYCTAQYKATLKEQTYVKPDTCYFKVIDASKFKGKTLREYLFFLEYSVSDCGIFFAYGGSTGDYKLNLTKKKGILLELVQDAIRGTDLDIYVMPPKNVGIGRKYSKDL